MACLRSPPPRLPNLREDWGPTFTLPSEGRALAVDEVEPSPGWPDAAAEGAPLAEGAVEEGAEEAAEEAQWGLAGTAGAAGGAAVTPAAASMAIAAEMELAAELSSPPPSKSKHTEAQSPSGPPKGEFLTLGGIFELTA